MTRWITFGKEAGESTLPRHDGKPGSASERLLEQHPEQADISWPKGFDAGIVHRLDGSTSGLLLVACSLSDLTYARKLFGSGDLRKRYRFLTNRVVGWRKHTITAPLAHDRKDRRKMVWQRGAKTPHRGKWYPAHTEFRRIGRRGDLHVWEAVITTGVTHQIRIHAASCGLALLGDRLYGGTAHPSGQFYLHHMHVEGWPEAIPLIEPPSDWPESL